MPIRAIIQGYKMDNEHISEPVDFDRDFCAELWTDLSTNWTNGNREWCRTEISMLPERGIIALVVWVLEQGGEGYYEGTLREMFDSWLELA